MCLLQVLPQEFIDVEIDNFFCRGIKELINKKFIPLQEDIALLEQARDSMVAKVIMSSLRLNCFNLMS